MYPAQRRLVGQSSQPPFLIRGSLESPMAIRSARSILTCEMVVGVCIERYIPWLRCGGAPSQGPGSGGFSFPLFPHPPSLSPPSRVLFGRHYRVHTTRRAGRDRRERFPERRAKRPTSADRRKFRTELAVTELRGEHRNDQTLRRTSRSYSGYRAY
jgi:hypothetical protein